MTLDPLEERHAQRAPAAHDAVADALSPTRRVVPQKISASLGATRRAGA